MESYERKNPRSMWQERYENGGASNSDPMKDQTYSRPNGKGNGGGSDHDPDPLHAHFSSEHQCLEYCPICRFADVVRTTFPPELQEQMRNWQYQAALTLKMLLDGYLDRAQDRQQQSDVQDIPIE